jgi:outer membrane receptor for ferrienterochelin and colicin
MRSFGLFLIFLFLQLSPVASQAQKTGGISGTVRDANTQELLPGVAVILENTTLGVSTDVEGRFQINNIPPGSYNLKASFIGYKPYVLYNIVVTTGNIQTYTIDLQPESQNLNEVVIQTNTFGKKTESPLSVQSLTAEEIKSNPGGNFDISRVVQALPGVAGSTGQGGGFRNDIIIRGGGPNENVFYLDGIEIPQINHFATQGSAGGPAGILNVSFIEDVTLNSSSFSSRFDNALSSIFQFKQREGSSQRLQGNLRLSGTEVALTAEGPLSKKTTFLASARRSYLDFLFAAIDLPIRPNYWDFQYKTFTRINEKTTLTTLGVGAIDVFKFGVPREASPEKEYTLRSAPSNNQWNYTQGAVLKRLIEKGYVQIALSRNMLDNSLDRFEDAQNGDESKRNLKIRSQEIENKLRVEVNKYLNGWKLSYGGVMQYVKYNNQSFLLLRKEITAPDGSVIQPRVESNFSSAIDFFKYGAFVESSKKFFNDKLTVSGGLRTDMNSFTNDGNNPLGAFSPRGAISYAIAQKWNVNLTAGRYFKIPVYPILGYRDFNGNLLNKDVPYTRTDHYAAGLEYLPGNYTRITVEGFYKNYANYPVSAFDGISLANQGTDFSILGNEKVIGNGKGRTYGFEVFFQQKLSKRIFATVSYTYVRSEFSGLSGIFFPSAWDSRHLISALGGYKFKKGWEVGVKYRYAGGAPYTPFDLTASQLNYLTLGRGVPDYSHLNALRLRAFNQFDFRIDKKINFSRTTLDLYLDIQNATLSNNPSFPEFTFKRTSDNSTWETTDGQAVRQDGSNAIPLLLTNDDALVVPTIGFILEF